MADSTYEIRKINVEDASGTLTLEVSGILDTGNAAAFGAEVRRLAAMQSRLSTLKLRLGGLSYVSSMGLGALVDLMLELRKKGVSLFLVNTPRQIQNVMDLLGFTKFMNLTTESVPQQP
jgi:anti-anti-sigma factor